VVNSVKAWKCQKAGERASGGHIVLLLAPPFFLCVIYFTMMVSLGLGVHFGGKSLSPLGAWSINTGLNTADGLLGSFASFENRDLVRVLLSD